MIKLSSLLFESSETKLNDGEFVLITINKKTSFYELRGDELEEIQFLPTLSREQIIKLKENNMSNFIFSLKDKKYFVFNDNCNFEKKTLSTFKKIGERYVFSGTSSLNIPDKNTRQISFKKFRVFDTLIKKHFIENLEEKKDLLCFEIISPLLPDEIPDKYIILYSYLSTYVLLNKELALKEYKRRNGMLRLYVNEKYIKHIVGIRGKKIKNVANELGINHISVYKKNN